MAAQRAHAPVHNLSEEDALEIALDAYIYAYPLVLMELARRVSTNVAVPEASGMAPMNRFGHRSLYRARDTAAVLRPDVDTLHSFLWFDVSREPLLVHVPEPGSRYYFLGLMDMWTDVFASFGTRTIGNAAQTFAIRGPKWQGPIPRGALDIRSPTEQGWIVGRIQTNGKDDLDAIHRFQNRLVAKSYSDYGDSAPPRKGEIHLDVDMSAPLEQIEKLEVGAFYSLFARAARANAPHVNDYPMLARLARLDLEPGRAFDIGSVSHVARAALSDMAPIAREKIKTAFVKTTHFANGWRMTERPVGTYGTDYLRRAATACAGLGAHLMEDAADLTALFDDEGRPLDSTERYALHFERGQVRPARAFWSLALHDERQQFVDNPLDRHAIGDRDKLIFNADGSLDIYVQRESPGAGWESNWLPAPSNGPFSLTMRLYWPKREALDGTWQPPALRRVA